MSNNPGILITKLNVFYPDLLGIGYLRYRKHRIQKEYFDFNPEKDLLGIVNNSILEIPFYQAKYSTQISTLDEFNNTVKFIDKDIVMGNWEDFILPGVRGKEIITGTTGGTSGKPLKLVLPKNRYVFELATMYAMWKNVGWHGQTRAVIRNQHLKDNQIFKTNSIKKEIIFDGFRTSQDYYYKVYKILRRHKIGFIHAYPSSAYQFASFLDREKLDVDFIKAFLCGSEALLPEHKELIKQRLGIKIYHWYGHSEKLVLGGYCRGSDLIHMEPTYGYFELIDETGNPVNEIGKTGEIVGTTLHNPYMPLIRYRTGDYAEYAGNYCSECKRQLPLIKNITGRWDVNRIFLNDGTYITITALNLHNDLYSYIEGMQYIQKVKGKLEILLIKGPAYNTEIENRFIDHFHKSFNYKCEFQIKYVSSLEKEPNGKFLPLKQYVS